MLVLMDNGHLKWTFYFWLNSNMKQFKMEQNQTKFNRKKNFKSDLTHFVIVMTGWMGHRIKSSQVKSNQVKYVCNRSKDIYNIMNSINLLWIINTSNHNYKLKLSIAIRIWVSNMIVNWVIKDDCETVSVCFSW